MADCQTVTPAPVERLRQGIGNNSSRNTLATHRADSTGSCSNEVDMGGHTSGTTIDIGNLSDSPHVYSHEASLSPSQGPVLDCPSASRLRPQLPCQHVNPTDKTPQYSVEDHADAIFVDDGDDYIIHPHLTCTVTEDKDKSLKTFPTCPGPLLPSRADLVDRPAPTLAFKASHPEQAAIYSSVIERGLPNYLGAKTPVEHQINIAAWRELQHLLEDQQLVDFLEYGFPIGYTGESPPLLDVPNHTSASQHPSHIDKYLQTECRHDALLGPLEQRPFTWFRHNPMMTRPKRDSHERRVILDLSYPSGNSVNNFIPKNCLEGAPFKMHFPRSDALAERICDLGRGCLLFKVDLSRAYRQLRSDPFDWAFLGVSWQGDSYLDTAIPFGLRHGASACQRTTEAIAQIAHHQTGSIIYPYVDDSSAAALPVDAFKQYNHLIQLMTHLDLQAALPKCQPPLTTLSWIGVDFESLTLIMRICADKIQQAVELCTQFLAMSEVTHKFMENDGQGVLLHKMHGCCTPIYLKAGRFNAGSHFSVIYTCHPGG